LISFLDLVGVIIALLSAALLLISINNTYQKKKAEKKFLTTLLCLLYKSYENSNCDVTDEDELIKINKLLTLINNIKSDIKVNLQKEVNLDENDTKDLLNSLDVAFRNMNAADIREIREGLYQPSIAGRLSYINKLLVEVITKDNQEDDIFRSRVWWGALMNGIWDGVGKWYLINKTMEGNGIWIAGTLRGTWHVKGKWETKGNGYGDFEGIGELISDIGFMNIIQRDIIFLGSILAVLVSALTYFILNVVDITAFIIFVLIIAITMIAVMFTQSTMRGKLWLIGTWEDVGTYRILNVTGVWKLGYHSGKWVGKMKDPLPV